MVLGTPPHTQTHTHTYIITITGKKKAMNLKECKKGYMRKYEVRKKKRERNEAIHYNTPPAPMKEEERHFLETIATVVSKSNFLTLSFFLYYLVLKY